MLKFRFSAMTLRCQLILKIFTLTSVIFPASTFVSLMTLTIGAGTCSRE